MIQVKVNPKKLEEHIRILFTNNIYKNKKISCCPLCGSIKYIKYGYYKEIQRYKCKKCGKTFSNTTNLLWSYSKKDMDKWIRFIKFMMKNKSLRFCARRLHISVATAFYWRHKILHGLQLDSSPNILEGNVHMKMTSVTENLKGCRNITTTRRSYIWIAAAKGDEDSMLIIPLFRDYTNAKIFQEKVYSKIKKGSYIVAYENDRYTNGIAKKHNKKRVKEVKRDDRIGSIRIHMRKWFKVFRGVATKYLEEYFSLYILFNLDKSIDYVNLIQFLASGERFIRIKEIGRN